MVAAAAILGWRHFYPGRGSDVGLLVSVGLGLLSAGALGFAAKPITIFKISAALLPVLQLHTACVYVKTGGYDWRSALFMAGGFCSIVVAAEILMAEAERRDINWAFVRPGVTACAVLSLLPMAAGLPYMFHSVYAAVHTAVLMATGLPPMFVSVTAASFRAVVATALGAGPSCFLAAAVWVGSEGSEGGTPVGIR